MQFVLWVAQKIESVKIAFSQNLLFINNIFLSPEKNPEMISFAKNLQIEWSNSKIS